MSNAPESSVQMSPAGETFVKNHALYLLPCQTCGRKSCTENVCAASCVHGIGSTQCQLLFCNCVCTLCAKTKLQTVVERVQGMGASRASLVSANTDEQQHTYPQYLKIAGNIDLACFDDAPPAGSPPRRQAARPGPILAPGPLGLPCRCNPREAGKCTLPETDFECRTVSTCLMWRGGGRRTKHGNGYTDTIRHCLCR
jgi:hypothetical protein